MIFQDFIKTVVYKNVLRKTNNVVMKGKLPICGAQFYRRWKKKTHESVKLNICVSQIAHD